MESFTFTYTVIFKLNLLLDIFIILFGTRGNTDMAKTWTRECKQPEKKFKF